jgi:hypothetical protein
MNETSVLGEAPSYPMVELLRRNGPALSLAAGALVFVAALGGSGDRGAGSVLRSLGLAAAAGLAVKNLSELNAIIADTLLPQ